jgi:hypothetical protein
MIDQTQDVEYWKWVENSHNANNGPQVVSAKVLGNATVQEGPDEWGGFFRSLISQGFGYAVQKDAVASGLLPRAGSSGTAANGQPVYMTDARGQAVATGMPNGTVMLLLGGALLAGVLLLRKG